MAWSSMTWKWPIPVLFCGMNHQKYKFSLISVSFSVGGCWGQNMLLFWKLVDETQIPQSQEYTDTFKQNLTCTFLSIRGNLKYTLCHEGPCRFRHRFFDQIGHQSMYASIGNKHFFTKWCHCQTYQNYEQPPQRLQNSDFPSPFLVIFQIFFFEEY